jgi:replicative DNA helicase
VEIIFIDYLQLIDRGLSVYSDCENADSGYVITELTRFAREYNIPLVITSSLTRNVTLRSGDKRPIISDLAGSDFIEELADNIILLHRPAYYGIIEDENGNDLSNVTEVIIAKSKDGTPGEIYLRKKPGSMILE